MQRAAGRRRRTHHITTIENVAATRSGKAVQAAWEQLDVVQCGYCQSGQIMSAAALLGEIPKPMDADIDAAMTGKICRCATYIQPTLELGAEIDDRHALAPGFRAGLHCGVPGHRRAPAPATRAEIDGLLSVLLASGCEFNRNGSWHNAAQAKAHLLRKLEYLEGENAVQSTETVHRTCRVEK